MANSDPSIPFAATSKEQDPSAPAGVDGGEVAQPAGSPDGTGTLSPEAAAPHRPGVVRRTTNRVKQFLLVLLGVIITLFAVSNSQDVKVRWVFGDPVLTPLILVIAITFVVGAAIGWLFAKLGGRHTSGE